MLVRLPRSTLHRVPPLSQSFLEGSELKREVGNHNRLSFSSECRQRSLARSHGTSIDFESTVLLFGA